MRHTCCSLLFESGANLNQVKSILGHRDSKTTLNVYTHVTKKEQEKTTQIYADYLSNYRGRVLAALEHLRVELVSRLRVHFARRKSGRQSSSRTQCDGHVPPQRALARREHHLLGLGRDARRRRVFHGCSCEAGAQGDGDTGWRAAHTPAAGRMLATFAFITVSWVFFRSATVSEAVGILGNMLKWPSSASGWLAPVALFPSTRVLLVAVMIGFFAVEWIQRRRECPLEFKSAPQSGSMDGLHRRRLDHGLALAAAEPRPIHLLRFLEAENEAIRLAHRALRARSARGSRPAGAAVAAAGQLPCGRAGQGAAAEGGPFAEGGARRGVRARVRGSIRRH